MNGKSQFSHVKNEITYNIPLVLDENVISSGISLISLWHTLADESYRVIWPRDKRKPLIPNSWVAIYTLQGCGKLLLRNGREIILNGNCIVFLKPTDIQAYCCAGLLWEQYWMEFTPTSAMEIPLLQIGTIYSGDLFNRELTDVAEMIAEKDPLKNNLAVAFLAKMIYQWICLISENGKKDAQLLQIENLLSILHSDLRENWSVQAMAQKMQCSEQHLRRLFLRYTGKTPKEYYLNARLELAHSLLKQEGQTVGKVADMLNFFDAFHFSKAFKRKFGVAPSVLLRAQKSPEHSGLRG
ncbi:helix-turn-helix transcriptional regulator [Pluralibacter gergoviae]|uniref:helix-turn-helix transcriptional regulator n=1 Tax=Pluralibacter gergoviae TaxID=61647 RepID=UPI0006AC8768|nr:helix-turn-helix transcriptional regulator [Pluralibacter gergoviae]KOQ99125.1 AraC family transcriptional regulator [Pluralibacter gergoviae]MCK1069203.1 helix-turn-helix transcriptional regulator [Pluralibacter gergoviae]MCV7761134.1 helix-turn-helix transcriptional regulator [Pluralibacter gergoviae]PHH45263.1 AraC family transcriptional regulator [Pluralibacter gergoviae]HDS1237209.1 AraC family transcriptional regulator [Pluralibacter gergoviae]